MTLNASASASACTGSESFALRVIGDSMAPEFQDGAIIIIEPEGVAADGSYVLAFHAEAWTFRQLARAGAGWVLRPLNTAWPMQPIADLSVVRGVIIQQATPGRRRASRSYLPTARKDSACPTTSTK